MPFRLLFKKLTLVDDDEKVFVVNSLSIDFRLKVLGIQNFVQLKIKYEILIYVLQLFNKHIKILVGGKE